MPFQSRFKLGAENAELRGVSNNLTHAGQVQSSSYVHHSDKAKAVRSMSKTTSRKEQRAPADPFLIKRTISAPASDGRENISKSAQQQHHEYDDGKQRRLRSKDISTVQPGSRNTSEQLPLSSPQTSYSLETSVATRRNVKDPNVYRSKSRPIEQTSDGGRRGASRDTTSSNTTDELPMECDRCRRGLQKLASSSLGDKDGFKTIVDHW